MDLADTVGKHAGFGLKEEGVTGNFPLEWVAAHEVAARERPFPGQNFYCRPAVSEKVERIAAVQGRELRAALGCNSTSG